MLPTLQEGQVVLVDPRAYKRERPKVGDVVIATDPRKPERKIVKRVVSASEYDGYYLFGDNANIAESTDSRVFGAVTAEHILGRVTGCVG